MPREAAVCWRSFVPTSRKGHGLLRKPNAEVGGRPRPCDATMNIAPRSGIVPARSAGDPDGGADPRGCARHAGELAVLPAGGARGPLDSPATAVPAFGQRLNGAVAPGVIPDCGADRRRRAGHAEEVVVRPASGAAGWLDHPADPVPALGQRLRPMSAERRVTDGDADRHRRTRDA